MMRVALKRYPFNLFIVIQLIRERVLCAIVFDLNM